MFNTNYFYCELSDKKLFALVKQDDKKAFEEIYSRYWSFLTQSASKHLQSKQKAEDIVQEIFISFYNRRYEIEFSVSLRAYLCQALKFKIMNEFRSQVVRNTYQKTIHYTYSYANANNSAYHEYESKELAYSINRSINLLPEKCRQAFLLSRGEELSYKDISGHLGISISTVEKHISKALKFLKVNLNM
jgi:RNA polymerase sigma-70 factor (family 1)